MGNALMEKGDLEVAIESYKQALKIKPDYAEVWNNLTFPLQAMKLQDYEYRRAPSDDLIQGQSSKQFQIAKVCFEL